MFILLQDHFCVNWFSTMFFDKPSTTTLLIPRNLWKIMFIERNFTQKLSKKQAQTWNIYSWRELFTLPWISVNFQYFSWKMTEWLGCRYKFPTHNWLCYRKTFRVTLKKRNFIEAFLHKSWETFLIIGFKHVNQIQIGFTYILEQATYK